MASTAAEAVTEREKVEGEMLERMAVIVELAGFLADPSDDRGCDCHGEGLDYEGEEWTLCECVLRRIGDLPSSRRAGEPPTPDEVDDQELTPEGCTVEEAAIVAAASPVEARAAAGTFDYWTFEEGWRCGREYEVERQRKDSAAERERTRRQGAGK